MRIALDATPLSVSTGGITRYTGELSRALAATHPEDEFWLLSDQPFPLDEGRPGNLKVGPRRGGVCGRRWWSVGLSVEMLRRRIGLFHGTDFAVPYAPLRPAVMTVHDLSPWLREEWHSGARRIRRRTPVLLGLGLATMVITPSKAVRREVIEHFRMPAERVVAVPLAPSGHFRSARPEPGENRRPYFLYVGVLEPRKNVPFLIEAWRALRRSHSVDLVLAGRPRDDFPPIPAEPGLDIRGEVSEEALAELYSGAVAVLYPSLYEGFGLPVLEAMSCGAAVLTSRDPAIAEVSGEAAIHLDAADRSAWMEAMEAVLTRPGVRREFGERALARASEFSWARTARETKAVYQEAVERHGR